MVTAAGVSTISGSGRGAAAAGLSSGRARRRRYHPVPAAAASAATNGRAESPSSGMTAVSSWLSEAFKG